MKGPTNEHDFDTCTALQQEEWEVLQSIHPDCLSAGTSIGSIRLEVPVDLPVPTRIALVHDNATLSHEASTSSGPSSSSTFLKAIELSTLPPIMLDIHLPPAYPFVPPQIRRLHSMHSWLRLDGLALGDKLLAKWEEGEGVLYTWLEWIHSGDFLDDLGLTATDEGIRTIRLLHSTPSLLLPALVGYNDTTQTMRFSQNSFECEVCLTSIKGARCIMLACSHVFCRSCLEDFWGLCIREGDVGRVGCPDPGCVKEQREASEEEVRRVCTEEEVLRWKWLRMKRALEKDPTLVHCPMPLCQTPVPKPTDVEEGSTWERLRTCSGCGYSFCAYCKRSWHGPVGHCPISTTKALLLEYMALEEGSMERKRMELRYGRSTLKKLIEEYEQERAFQEWLERSTGTPCPGCELRVEKHSGCNHMTCIRCKQHYCYRCGATLDRTNPYKHFSTPGLRCFSKLFDLESIDDEWQPVEGFDAL